MQAGLSEVEPRPLMSAVFDVELRCPHCGGRLERLPERTGTTSSAELICGCGQRFPVIDGIPRFVEQQHLASFGRQWNTYEVAHDDEDRATFEAKTGIERTTLSGLRVLDAGCGGGRYSKVAAEAGATVIGVDHSTAVEKAAALCAQYPSAAFAQADLKCLPLELSLVRRGFLDRRDASRRRHALGVQIQSPA